MNDNELFDFLKIMECPLVAGADAITHADVQNKCKSGCRTYSICKNAEVPVTQFAMFSGDQLLGEKLPDIKQLVDGLLIDKGVFLLAGASKSGKSWLAMDLSLCISNGDSFLGRKTTRTKVLYIDLESSKHSLQSRIRKIIGERNVSLPNWYGLQEFKPIGKGFEDDLTGLVHREGIGLVIVDVMVKIRSQDKNIDRYERDYHDFGVLKKLAKDLNICILAITHTRKLKDADDIFNEILGSVGVMGSCDGSIILSRKRGEDGARLLSTGRDLRELDLALQWSESSFRWDCLGDSAEVEKVFEKKAFAQSAIVQAVQRLLAEHGGAWTGTVRDLFNVFVFDYQEISGLPCDDAKLGVELKKNTHLFAEIGVSLTAKRTNKGILYQLKKI
jgi:hypothetical protein